jgi:predicted nucleotidyltransferase
MIQLLPEQIDALCEIQTLSADAGAEIVIIGAIAYRHWIDNNRQTDDIDVTVALNLADFERLSEQLLKRGWKRDNKMEHRWYSPKNVRIDILLAGDELRAAGQITWPQSQAVMS